MERTTPNSLSNQETTEPKQPHRWLQKHYDAKRERTVRLVKAAVDDLVKAGQAVTTEAICRKSLELDPEGRGVKKSSILENPIAHAYYCEHSASYRAAQARKRRTTRKGEATTRPAQSLRIDSNRDVDRVRYRYMQMTKPEIVERLLIVEQAYAKVHQQLTQLQFQLVEREQQREEEQQQARQQMKRKRGNQLS